MKILLAVPTFENIQPEVFKAIYDMDKGGNTADFVFVKGYDCAKARTVIAKKALEGAYDYVLMIDSDTVVPKDALVSMLTGDPDVVLGCCPRKNTTERKTALFPMQGRGFKAALSYDDLKGTERIELKGGGFACALVRTQVFSAMKYPYFRYVVYENGDALSEDLYFCLEAKKAGFRIWADPRVKCGHLSRKYQYE